MLELAHDNDILNAIASSSDPERPVCEETDFTVDGNLQDTWAEEFYDNVTGQSLDADLVRQARKTKVEFINHMKVWDKMPRQEAARRGIHIIQGRWVDVNKSKDNPLAPNYRSRWVAKEIKRGVRSSHMSEFFAAMPPTSSSKTLLALALTSRFQNQGKKIE